MEYYRRIDRIIDCLVKSNNYISSTQIAEALDLSSKTVRNEINIHETVFSEYGLSLDMKAGLGYCLTVKDFFLFHEYESKRNKQQLATNSDTEVASSIRLRELLLIFLSADDYIKLEDIADSLFISKSTLNQDMKEIKKLIKPFHLELAFRSHSGLKLQGNEFNKRMFYLEYIFISNIKQRLTQTSKFAEEGFYESLTSTLYQELKKHNFHISDENFYMILKYIFILLIRVEIDHQTIHENFYDNELLEKKEYAIATTIIEYLSTCFQLQLQHNEQTSLAIILSAYGIYDRTQTEVISDDAYQLSYHILTSINQNFKYDFKIPGSIYMDLALYLYPLLTRLQYEISVHNPSKSKVQLGYEKAYELALFCQPIIQEKCNKLLSSDELSYLTLFFANALLDDAEEINAIKILLVCPSGPHQVRCLIHSLSTELHINSENIYPISIHELKRMEQSQYDFIISTAWIPVVAHIPLFRIDSYPSVHNINSIKKLLEQLANRNK